MILNNNHINMLIHTTIQRCNDNDSVMQRYNDSMMQLCNDTMIYHLLLDLTTSKLPHNIFFACMSCVLVVGHIPDRCVFSIINVEHHCI